MEPQAVAPPPARQAQLRPPRRPGLLGWLRYRLRGPRQLRTTRQGKYFLGITFAVGFAAINTGNNLLYLSFGLLISMLVLSGVLSEWTLRGLTLLRHLPARCEVGRRHFVEVEVYNHKKRIPSYAVEVEDLREGRTSDKRCFFLKIAPKTTQVAAYRRLPQRRGSERFDGLRVTTRFPFGFFEKSRDVAFPGETLAYPAITPVALGPVSHATEGGAPRPARRGRGDDVLSLRLMREGDDPRDIYWKKSTHPAQPRVLKERASPARPEACLRLDPVAPSLPPPEAWEAAFEARISEVASRAVAHLARGDEVVLELSTGHRFVATPDTGADAILRVLALLEPVEAAADAAGSEAARARPNAETARPLAGGAP